HRATKPLAELPATGTRALLFDIDDTLTTDGKLTAEAYAALERLHRTGKSTVAVTGRPAGWCDHIARMWPVDAVVGENGAFYFRYDRDLRTLTRRFAVGEEERASRRATLAGLAREIGAAVRGCGTASDQPYR